MRFKKLLIAGVAVLGLASISGVSANASSYFSRDISEAEESSTKYARHSMDLERLSHGSVFAYIHQTGHKWIHRGEAIKVAPFYHMGHDGFIVHIPGNGGIYYAPTNSYRWFSRHGHHKSHYYYYDDYNHGYVNRTNKKRLLNKSGYYYNGEIIENHSPLDSRSYIPKHFKLKRGMIWMISPDYEVAYEYEGHGHWDIDHE